MRRLIASLLLILTLAGCQNSAGTPSATPDVSTNPPTAAPPSIEPTATLEPEYTVKLPGASLPDSEYTAGYGDGLERFYGRKMDELVANKDYGAIYPYLASEGSIGFAVEGYRSRYGLFNADGLVVCEPVFESVELVEEMYICTMPRMRYHPDDDMVRRYFVCALDGSWVREFDEARASEVGALCNQNGKWGILGADGEWLMSPKYTDINQSGDNLCAAVDGKYGIIDYNGNWLISPRFDYPLFFSDGLAAVTSRDSFEYSYIDMSGKVVHGPYPSKADGEGWGLKLSEAAQHGYTDEEVEGARYRLSNLSQYYNGYVYVFIDNTMSEINLDGSPYDYQAERTALLEEIHALNDTYYHNVERVNYGVVKYKVQVQKGTNWYYYLLGADGGELYSSYDYDNIYTEGDRIFVDGKIFDLEFNLIADTGYSEAEPYGDYIRVCKEHYSSKDGLIDKDFNVVLPLKYDNITVYDGMIVATGWDYSDGYIAYTHAYTPDGTLVLDVQNNITTYD